MQDSEDQQPSRPAAYRNSYQPTQDDDLSAPGYRPARSLPRNALLSALGAGAAGGLLSLFLTIAITLVNSGLFQEAARLGDKMPYNTATTIAGLQCLDLLFSLVICFITGFIVGRLAVKRLYGFYAGILVGAIYNIGGQILQYISNYPGNRAATTPTAGSAVAGGILFLLVLLLIWSLVGGLVALWGTWTATRRHPYYTA